MEKLMESWGEILHMWNPEPAALFIAKLVGSIIQSLFALSRPEWHPPYVNATGDYDFIVVGAGMAGSALVYHLGVLPSVRILLLEAGGDPPLSADIPYLNTNIQRTRYDWGFQTVPQTYACQAYRDGVCYWPRGKMLGGSSMLTGMTYVTGHRKDYNRWANLENPGWGWESVAPYFERFVDTFGVNSYENHLGGCDDITTCMKNTIISAAEELDFIENKGRDEAIAGKIGYTRSYGMVVNGSNNHAGKMFLGPAIERKNVDVVRNALVTKINIDPETLVVKGVTFLVDGQSYESQSKKEVILCAGTVNNPKLLMLSGVGPKEHLEQMDIGVIKHLPGVGKNLHDHVGFPAIVHKIHKSHCNNEFDETLAAHSFLLQNEGPLTSVGVSNILGFLYTRSGERSDYPNMEMHHFYLHKYYAQSFLTRYGFIPEINDMLQHINEVSPLLVQIPTLLNPKSRGEIRLKDNNPLTPPIINPMYLTEEEDVLAMIRAAQHGLRMGETEAMQAAEAELVKMSAPGCSTEAIKTCSGETASCCEWNTDCYWRCTLQAFAMTGYAPAGTCKMGKCSECGAAVVNSNFMVHGITGLRVADASIIPEVISGDINAATIMIGERAACELINQYGKGGSCECQKSAT